MKTTYRKVIRVLVPVVAAAAVSLASWAFWWEPSSLTAVEVCVAVPWPASQPLRAAVLTDLHIGSRFNDRRRLLEIVSLTNAARPDLVAILGDLVVPRESGESFVDPEVIAAELAKLRAAAGVFAVLGNHESWFGARRVRSALENNGIPVLQNRAMRVDSPAGPLWVAGISDFRTGRPNLKAALAEVTDAGEPVILLTHNPDIFPQVPSRVSLTLAGHTHGGQVRFPIIGSPIARSRYGQRYVAGHIVEGGRHLYVATGIGTSIIPVRFGVPPAIFVLTISAQCPAVAESGPARLD